VSGDGEGSVMEKGRWRVEGERGGKGRERNIFNL